MNTNLNLNKAKHSKYDEFYIIYEDALKTISLYAEQFKGQAIYCNTDDYRISNIWKVFYDHFSEWGLKSLTATGYKMKGHGVYAHYDGKEMKTKRLRGNGDYRSSECLKILNDCDMCVTCPPFSLGREYIEDMYKSGKKYLTLCGITLCSYQFIIDGFRHGYMTRSCFRLKNALSFNMPKDFIKNHKDSVEVLSDGSKGKKIMCIWITNMLTESFITERVHMKKMEDASYSFITTSKGEKILYPDTVNDIPVDYSGLMRLPITSLDYVNPENGTIEGVYETPKTYIQQEIEVLGNEETVTGDYRFYSEDGKKKFPGIVVRKSML